MKRLIAAVLCICLIVSLAACNTESGTNDNNSAKQESRIIKDGKPVTGEIGAIQISIEGYALTKDYQGNDAIVIYYEYTNKGENPVSFLTTISRVASQNGEELSAATLIDPDVTYDIQSSMQQVEKGQTIPVQTAFILKDTTSPVNIELQGFGEAANQKVEKVFTLKK